ncbi:TolC family protein [Nannocystis pusilla]|uniref:TolC family protein n=1 Tax=Nannocystis pusilla TaxID=889268 RepID=UPI003BF1C4AF
MMLTERRGFRLLLAGASTLPSGCLTSSIVSDVAELRARSGVAVLADVADASVDPDPSEDARALLREPLDADTAVRVALLNNRMLRAQLRELGVARGRLIQARQVANPLFEAEALPERNTALELRVEYDITSLVLAPLRAKAAAAELAAERLEVAGAVVQLGYDVRAAFHALQSSRSRLVLAGRMLDVFAAGRDAATALLEAGSVPALDASSRIAAFERARVTVAQLELEVADRRERLQRLLGLHARDTPWEVRAELPQVPDALPVPDAPETRAIRASLELAAMKSRLEAIAQRTRLSRTQGWLPEIDVDLHSLHGDPSTGSGPRGPWRFGGGVALRVPLFDRQRGTTRAHEAEFDALMERYHGVAIDVRSAAREQRNRVVSAHARARQYQKIIVPAQRRVVEQTQLQYNAMQVGVFQLLQAHRDQLDIELAYVETLREYWDATAALDALLAGRRVTLGTAASTTDSVLPGGH